MAKLSWVGLKTGTPQVMAPRASLGDTYLGKITLLSAAATEKAYELQCTINQSGTAGYTGLDLNLIEAAVGTGSKLLLNLRREGNSQLSVDRVGNLTMLGAIDGLTEVRFNTSFVPSSHIEGSLHWNDDDGTLEVDMPGGNVALQVGQELLIRARNESGSTITNGSVVQIAGASGNKPLITLLGAGVATTPAQAAIATEDIANNSNGYVNQTGTVRDLDTSSYVEGTPLYLSAATPGALTDTPPSAPDHVYSIGVVTAQHATTGSVYFRPTFPIHLTDISDVNGTTPDATNKHLVWDNANSYWDAAQISYADLADKFDQDLLLDASSGIETALNINPTVNQSGTAGYTALTVDVTETALGSGAGLLQDWKVGGVSLASLGNGGNLHLATTGSETDLQLKLGAAGTYGFYYAGTTLNMVVNAIRRFYMNASGQFRGDNSNGPGLADLVVGATTATLLPRASDTNTGLGSAGFDMLSGIAGGKEGFRLVENGAWGISTHMPEVSAAPTPISSWGSIYPKADNILYFQDGAGVEHVAAGGPIFKSYTFVARDAASGENFQAGFYNYAAADANLTQASTTVTQGTANVPYGAHAFIVSGGNGTTDGSDLVLTVSGTSITDAGVRTPADSEVIVATATSSAVDTYYETPKKWIGQITFTLSSTGGTAFNYDFNYGLAKYEDFGNRLVTLTDFEFRGLANANDSGFDIEILKHSATGWTFHATAFVAGSTPLHSLTDEYGAESDLSNGEPFSFKHSGLSDSIDGTNEEGILIRVTTGANNSVSYMNCHLGAKLH